MTGSTPHPALVVAVLLTTVAIGGCAGTQEYTITAGEPQTGEIFGEVTDTEISRGWSTTARIDIRYSIDEEWVGPDGNWSIPNESREGAAANGTDAVTINELSLNGDPPSVLEGERISPTEYGRSVDVLVPDEEPSREYGVRAVAGGEVVDAVNITVRKSMT